MIIRMMTVGKIKKFTPIFIKDNSDVNHKIKTMNNINNIINLSNQFKYNNSFNKTKFLLRHMITRITKINLIIVSLPSPDSKSPINIKLITIPPNK